MARSLIACAEPPETAPDWVIKALEEKDKEHAEACREEFRERANLIASDWSKLQRASDTISDVRSRWTAHLEVEYESTTKSYRIVDLTSLVRHEKGALLQWEEDIPPGSCCSNRKQPERVRRVAEGP